MLPQLLDRYIEVCKLQNKKEPHGNEALVAKISTCKYHENLKPIYFIELSDGRCFKCEEYDRGLNNALSSQ